MAIPSEGLRTCKACGIPQPADCFYAASKAVPHWRTYECKKCRTKYAMNRYYNDGVRDRVKGRRDALRDSVFNAYGGYVCACCGEKQNLFLQIDHINNDGGEFRRRILRGKQTAAGGTHTYRWLAEHGFPPGYQVLCSNCNYGKRMNGGVCPHQTTSNDQRQRLVGSSEPKRNEPLWGYDMVCSEVKASAVPESESIWI